MSVAEVQNRVAGLRWTAEARSTRIASGWSVTAAAGTTTSIAGERP